MKDLAERLAALKPAQRALLEARLRKKKLDLDAVARRAESLAEGADGEGPDAAPRGPRPIPRRPPADAYPLSVDQERIYFIQELNPGSPFYNIYDVNRFRGEIDLRLLHRTLDEIVRRHETLRTRFETRDGRAVQIVEEPFAFRVPLVDLSALAPARARAVGDRLVTRFLKRPFALDRLPLCRSLLVRLEDGKADGGNGQGRSEGAVRGELLWPVVYHHLVIDWVSTFTYQRELVELYRAFGRGLPSPLPELPVQYADYALWQRQQLTSEALAPQLEHWRRHLEGVPHATELPLDRPRPAVPTGEGKRRPFELSPEDSAALRRLAQRQGTTLFMAFLALFKVLVLRLSGQPRIVVGTPMTARNHPDLEPLLGYFLYQLVLFTDLGGAGDFAETLRRVRSTTLGAYANKDLPFAQVVELVEPERDLGRMPLTQLTFLFLNPQHFDVPRLPGIEPLPYAFDGESSKFDVTLVVWDRDEAFDGLVEYNSELFDAATVARWVRQLRSLLRGAVGDPGRPLGELALLGAGERQQLLQEWNDTAALAGGPLVPERVAATAAARPEAVAVVAGAGALSYAGLLRRSDRLAARLGRTGVGPKTLVGVCLDRSLEVPAALLGVLRAGAAYVPLDPDYPQPRLAAMLEASRAPVVVGRRRLADRLPESGARRLWIDEDGGAGPPASVAAAPAAPEGLAYVIFTSGSTGRPKGVQVPHRALVNFLHSMANRPGLGADDVLLAVTTLSFDIAALEIFLPLMVGARVVMASTRNAADGRLLAGELARRRATAMQATPSRWWMLAAAGWQRPPGFAVMTGGEALGRELASTLADGGTVWNLYGPTETTVWSAAAEISAERPITLGRPIAATSIHLLDRALRPLPAGSPGELWIGGAGLARGYLDRPALTAERFVPDPLDPEPGGRLYRTGDLARRLPNGEILFLGRADHQLKVRGFRIEPGEVEAALAALGGVGEAVVVGHGGGEARRLVAYLTAPGEPPGAASLRAALAERLPDYMVPTAFAILDALPRLPNGKVDRGELARRPPPATAEGPRAPRTPDEELLATIWSEVLERGLEDGGLDPGADFFTLGGHSLLATRMLSRVRRVFGVELPLRAVFEAPTLETMAARIAAARRPPEERGPAPPPLTRGGRPRLSFAQERMWFLDRMDSGSPAYNLPLAVRLRGAFAPAALAAGLAALARRHQMLRTTFPADGGRPRLRIAPDATPRLPLVDLATLAPRRRQGELERLVRDEAARGFDLAAGPLWRTRLVRLAADDHALLATLHHIIADAWSLGIFVGELMTLYRAVRERRASPLPPLAVEYTDVARWQRRWLRGAALERPLAYWRRELAEAIPLELPADRPRRRSGARPATAANVGLRLPKGLAGGLRRLTRERGATLFMGLLATFAAVLGRTASKPRVTVGSPIAGRDRLEMEPLVGLFVNTLALRVDLEGDPGFGELLERVRERTLAAYAHREVPFEKVVAELEPERDLGTTPFFQAMLVLQNAPTIDPCRVAAPGLELEPLAVASAAAKFDLTLALVEEGDELAGTLELDRDLFDRTTIVRLARRLERLLEGALESPSRPLSELPFLDPGERQQLALEWSGPESAAPAGLLDERVELRAARAPEAVAIVEERSGEARGLSYGELARRARALARRLRDRGVGPEDVVGVSLERSLELVSALLGVLRTGAAYLPLDPAHPRERRARLLADAGAAALVTDAETGDPAFEGPVLGAPAPGDGEPFATPGRRSPDGLAYLIYTSGSTGEPKGVMVSHRNAARLFSATAPLFGNGPRDVWSFFHSAAFDFSVWEVWGALVDGARLAVVPYWAARDPGELARLLRRQRVSVLSQTPSAFAQLLPEVSNAGLPALRHVVFGGEALAPEGLRPWLERPTSERPRLVNMYGITETTVHVTWRPLERRDLALAGRSPLGRPLPDLALEILDRRGRAAALGTAGEICVGGAGVARGYLGRPGLTSERFVPDPRCGAPGRPPGARLYRSGDLARRGAGGELFYLGRIDHQVKVRGFRVELGEIEAALRRLDAVRQAAVLERGDERLIAYVVPADGTIDPARLRAALAETLPEHMLPAAVDLLDALPLNANGKLDRALLRRRPLPSSSASGGETTPRTPLEELVAGVFCDVLGVERAGPRDDFFALGGHSLLATRALSRLRDLAGVEIPLRSLFERPTVAALAAAVEAARRRDESPAAPLPRSSAEVLDAAPLSFAQERLWILDRLEPGNPAYHMPFALRLSGELDAAALSRAVDELERRHEALRSVYPSRGGRPLQRLGRRPGPALARTDLDGLPRIRRDGAALRLGAEVARRPFDLERGPLVRWLLVRLEETEHRLYAVFHHIVCDGWSLGILTRDLGRLYDALRRGETPALAPPGIRYAEYASWQRGRLRGPELERQLAYWRRRLAEMPAALDLPTDRPRPAVRSFRGQSTVRELDPGLSRRLERLGRRLGATPFMTLLAAFAVVLRRLSGATYLAVGTPIAGRGRSELEDVVGIFLNTLVLRLDLAANPPFEALLGEVRETALDAYAHQDLPFEKLLDELQPERDLSRTPLFQVFFNMLNLPLEPLQLERLEIEPLAARALDAKFDLTVYASYEAGRVRIELVSNAELFSSARVTELLRTYERVLEQIADDPSRPVDALSLRTSAAEEVLPDPRRPLAAGGSAPIHELVAAATDAHPERVAVADPKGHWSYGELGRRSARLARRLQDAGAGRGTAVLVYAHRSAPLAWAVLGVLEVGAAFVLLDPAYPGVYLAAIARRCRPRVCLALAAAGPLPAELDEALRELGAARLELSPGSDRGGSPALRPPERPRVAVAADDLAAISFTSGSTGEPKGILGRHGPLSHFLPWQTRRFGLSADDRYSLLSGLAHDPLQRDLFTPLATGATLVAPDPAEIFTAGYLAAWMARERVSVSHLTPAMTRVLATVPAADAAAGPRLSSLRRAFLTGDVLTRGEVDLLRRLAPRAECFNFYGSTETQRAVAYYPASTPEAPVRDPLPLGRGMRDVQLLVVGPGGQPAGVGELGEIWVRSPHLARGYLGDGGLTGARFGPNPWGRGEPRDRVYRTGDLGRYLPSGDVAFAGRADRQVKVRGYRIELGEIEACLERLEGVRQAVALVLGGGAEGRLAACVAAGPKPFADLGGRLTAELRRRLPAHMTPAGVAVFERLPLTPNGKLDRRALAAAAERQLRSRDLGSRRESPASALERTIAGLVAEVLGIAEVDAEESFFDLGANSLSLVELHARLQDLTGERFPALEIFQHPTVRSLVAFLGRSAAPAAGHDDRVESLRSGRERLRHRRMRRRRASRRVDSSAEPS